MGYVQGQDITFLGNNDSVMVVQLTYSHAVCTEYLGVKHQDCR